MILKIALRNVISKKSSFVILIFIAFAITLMVITNAIFDSTKNGIEKTFVSSFTGDGAFVPEARMALSLFGDETPVTGKLFKIPVLSSYNSIQELLNNDDDIENVIPLLSGSAGIVISDTKTYYCNIFGIDPENYLKTMKSIKIIDGKPWNSDEKGALLTKKIAEKLGKKVGDEIEFIMHEGFSFRIRSVPVSAIYEYEVENPVLDKIVLSNCSTVRSLFEITDKKYEENVELSEEKENLLENNIDFDSLFDDFSDLNEAVEEEQVSFTEDEIKEYENSLKTSTAWNFVLFKFKEGTNVSAKIRKYNKVIKNNGWSVKAASWRQCAGSSATYLSILRYILLAGILIILFAGFIVINNTLLINILDRVREIGTIRAIGGSKLYIAFECGLETIIISVTAGIIGCILGSISSHFINIAKIPLHNGFLQQLFGGSVITSSVSLFNILMAMALSVIIGLIAWIIPVRNALKFSPVQAMQGSK